MKYMEQTALHYTNGIVIVDRCYFNKIRVSYTYFTHRSIPSIFVQEIYFTNAFSEPFIFDLEQKGHTVWDSTSKRTIKYVKNIRNSEKQLIFENIEVVVIFLGFLIMKKMRKKTLL